jgi:acetoin utilization protein AcuB
MLARDVMRTDVKSVEADAPAIKTALALMRQHDIRHLLVLRAGRLAGIVSNHDYRRVLDRADATGTIRNVHEITVGDIMTPVSDLVSGRPETPLLNIAQLMVLKNVSLVPIVNEGGRVVGVVSQKDVIRELARERMAP